MRTEKGTPHTSLLLVVLTLISLVTAGCAMAPATAPRASDQWSNGKLVGTAILKNRLGFQVDDLGHSSVVWIGRDHELIFARLDERAELVSQGRLDLETNSPLRPQLLRDSSGGLHLTWLDRRDRGLQLMYARLSPEGGVVREATAISPPETRAAESSMVLDPGGRTVELFWSDNTPSRPGIHHAALDWSGEVVVPPEMLIEDAISPAAQTDRQGFVHLAWRVEPEADKPEFHYAVYDPQRRALGPDIVASEPLIQMGLLGGPTAGAAFDGPWLGLDQSSVYLAWVLEVRERGNVMDFTFYQAFPLPALGQRAAAETFDYLLPEVDTQAVHVQGVEPSLTGDPRFLEGQPDRQVMACFTQVAGPRNLETLQIATVDVGPELITGQEVVSGSRGASVRPSVGIDGRGSLHLAWIDTAGFESYDVVYASNSPDAKAVLNRITAYDVVDRVLSVVVNILSALFFVPIAFSWMLLPIGWLAVSYMTGRGTDVSDPRGRRAVGLAMLMHLGVKLLFFGDLLARLTVGPPIPASLDLLLGRWIVPVLLAAVSAGAAWLYLKRGRGQSIFVPYLVFAVVDSILTLVIYVALPMGRF